MLYLHGRDLNEGRGLSGHRGSLADWPYPRNVCDTWRADDLRGFVADGPRLLDAAALGRFGSRTARARSGGERRHRFVDYGLAVSLVPFDEGAAAEEGTVVLHRLGPTEVMAFGPAWTLDVLGQTEAEADRPFVDAMRTAIAAAPQIQGAVDGLTGRVVRLTAEGARLLSDNESMRTTVLTGVVRNAETGRIAGHLTFIDPRSIAGLAGSLPSIAGGAAMLLQLARIEKALDGLKRDLAYLIRHEHLKVEAGIEVNLRILGDVYSTCRRRQTVEDDQWDRVANIERSVRSLHLETAKHLRALDEALDGEALRLPARVARLNRALNDERTLVWLRAHVHAEVALTRWEALYLLRQVELHPEDLDELVVAIQQGIDERHRALAGLSQAIARYLSIGGKVSALIDRIRLVRRLKLKALLKELDELLGVFPREFAGLGEAPDREPIPLGDGTPDRKAGTGLQGGRGSAVSCSGPAQR